MKAQIWIETTIYTLIGLALIAMVLSFALPKINASQDKVIIEQTVNSFEELDNIVSDLINSGSGNKRVYEIEFKSGEIVLIPLEDKIEFLIKDMDKPYSQENVSIEKGDVNLISMKEKEGYSLTLILNYSGYINLSLNGNEESKIYSPSPTPYKFILSNEGIENSKVIIDISDN